MAVAAVTIVVLIALLNCAGVVRALSHISSSQACSPNHTMLNDSSSWLVTWLLPMKRTWQQ